MKPLLVVTLLSSVALAGCTDDGDGPGDGAVMVDGDEPVAGLQMPQWQMGDWWTYDTTWGTTTLVVTEDNGLTWTVDTDSADWAFAEDMAPYGISLIGPISKTDLSGDQDGTPVRFFDWPLQHNKQWTTQWDGAEFAMTSHVGDDGTAHIVAQQGETTVNQMVYDASVGWFDSIIYGDPETGEEYGRIDLVESGSDWSGDVVRVDAEVLDSGMFAGLHPPVHTSYGTIDIEDGAIVLQSLESCASGSYGFGIGTVEGTVVEPTTGLGLSTSQGYGNIWTCPSQTIAFFGIISTDLTTGEEWRMIFESQSPDVSVQFTVWLAEYERITL